MILFRREHVQPILEGRKTETRRLGKKRWNVGAVHQARTSLFKPETAFARLRILDVKQQRLGDINAEEAWAEGYDSIHTFRQAFWNINGYPDNVDNLQVWVIKFQLEVLE